MANGKAIASICLLWSYRNRPGVRNRLAVQDSQEAQQLPLSLVLASKLLINTSDELKVLIENLPSSICSC